MQLAVQHNAAAVARTHRAKGERPSCGRSHERRSLKEEVSVAFYAVKYPLQVENHRGRRCPCQSWESLGKRRIVSVHGGYFMSYAYYVVGVWDDDKVRKGKQ